MQTFKCNKYCYNKRMKRKILSENEEEQIMFKKMKKILKKIENKYKLRYKKIDKYYKNHIITSEEYVSRLNHIIIQDQLETQKKLKATGIAIDTGSLIDAAPFKNKRVLYSPNYPPQTVYMPKVISKEEYKKYHELALEEMHQEPSDELYDDNIPEVKIITQATDDNEFTGKRCPFCGRFFHTFRKIYCCTLCEYKAYQKKYIETRKATTLTHYYSIICPRCHKPFYSRRYDKKTCSDACRMAMSRNNKK